MKKIVLSFVIIFLIQIFSTRNVFGQNVNKQQIVEDLIEEIASNSDQEVDFSTIYDDLQGYLDEPLNLNEATYNDLIKLHFLSDLQIEEILKYRKKYGDFASIYELQLLDDFSKEDIEKLIPFVTIQAGETHERKLKISNIMKYGRNQLILRTQSVIQPMLGFNIPDSVIAANPNKARFLGNPFKYYVRYKYQYRDRLQWGFTAEKDPGEEFFKGAQKSGFDFYSAYFQMDNKHEKYTNRIILGDFQAQYGQGLALWTGLTFGKSAYVLNIKKKPQGLRKYSSTDENQFLRGAGVTFNFDRLSVSAFASYHKIDANISSFDTIDQTDIREISSILNTGYHRTPSEIENRHTIGQEVFGGNITYNHPLFKTGLTFVDYKFSADLNKNLKPYQLYDFQGNQGYNLGWNYEFEILKFHFFGETAMSQNLGLATVNGVTVPLEHRVTMVALYRNYSKEYQSYFSGAFGESSNVNNEKGIYWGLEIYPYKNFKFSSYVDSYTFPWLAYRINTPISSGIEYFTQLDYSPKREFSMYIRFKHEIKPQNISSDVHILYPVDVTRWNLRFHFNFVLTDNIVLKSRLEFSDYSKDKSVEKGFLAYQDIDFALKRIPLKINFRYAIFDAPYNARIYAYESDVLYAFSVPAYFYKGFRTYINLRYKITDKLILWLRYSQFTYTDRNVIAANGLNEIDGNTKSEFKVQLAYKFALKKQTH